MRDPRNWVPTVTAIVVGSAAADRLVLVAPASSTKRRTSGLKALERSMRGVASDVRPRTAARR